MFQTMQGVADLGRRVTSMDSRAEEKRVAEHRFDGGVVAATGDKSVSYTHLTLPTIYSV